MEFYSKARNLSLLKSTIKKGMILDQISFGISTFEDNCETIREFLIEKGWDKVEVIVRSSSHNEDRIKTSLAGRYLSLRAKGWDEVFAAIARVINSIDNKTLDDEVFIQPYITNVKVNGVVFGVDMKSKGNYMVIEMNDNLSNDMFVTSGNSSNNQLFYFYDGLNNTVEIRNKLLKLIVDLIHELEDIFNTKKIDVEFIIDDNEIIYLLQVRPLIVQKEVINADDMNEKMRDTLKKLRVFFSRDDNLYGSSTILGIMPDWNPAEILGFKPNKLAYSLYDKLILESAWESGRVKYGYNEIKNKELMLNILGIPYIDVRKSFNSLLPKGLRQDIAEKIVSFYLEKLRNNPSLHDKVEFEIVYSCYTFNNDLSELQDAGLSKEDITIYEQALFSLTNHIICTDLIYEDVEKSRMLSKIRKHIMGNTNYTYIEKIKYLIDSCIEYGTIPFSGVARAAFIAEEFLRSFVNTGIFTKEDYDAFKEGNNCITSQMLFDLNHMETSLFIKKYGHLRPGTYDITKNRYDDCDISKIISLNGRKIKLKCKYILCDEQMQKIQDFIISNQFKFDVNKLIAFISDAICYREEIKFEFTKNISEILNILKSMANCNGYTIEDISNCNIDALLDEYNYLNGNLQQLIESGKIEYNNNKSVVLPELMLFPENIILFKMINNDGNFITNLKAKGEIVEIESMDNNIKLDEKIVLVERADPGFDWMFLYKIKGFITKFGGANSHMAIRANELSIPAIIGVGERNYDILRNYKIIEIDCLQRKVNGN